MASRDNIPERFLKMIQEAKEKQLEELDLSNEYDPYDRYKLTKIPEEVFDLKHLKVLKLNDNQLSTLPESLGNLINLTELDLSYNQLSILPESLGNISNLTHLYLKNNQLTSVPESLGNLSNLTQLDLNENPLVNPPIAIINKGTEAIKDYLKQLEEKGKDYLYEAKLLIVGEAGAGKTTLANKIQNPQYQLQEDQPSTEGIDVIKWSFLDNEREFKVNIWDFGGQEIYHATHQFFLTRRSLYTLVADSRKDNTDFYYWLNVVELLSNNSPLLIIKNEKQDLQSPREINERALRGQFINLKETLATNLKTNRGLKQIINNVKHYIKDLPHIGETLPKTWVKVRQALESDSRNYISLQEYFDICKANGFTKTEDKLQLSGYFHDLGVCLHFQDEEDSLLYKTVILKPEWGTDAVYKVLDNKQVIDNQGRFTRNDLKNIWQDEKYALIQGELLELMTKFQLCYEIPDRKDTFIAPQLLSNNQPEYDWNESHNLILCYTYPDFMPKGIISRFIVVMHQYIDQQQYVWKTGVILNKDNTKAEVIEDYGKREIKIRVIGENKRDFMTIVTYELDKINNYYQPSNYQKLTTYQKLIPCNCKVCQTSQDPNFYDYETLKRFLTHKEEKIQCYKSFEMVNVSSLINDVFILTEQDRDAHLRKDPHQRETTIVINYDKSNNMMTGDQNIDINQGNYNERIEGNYYEQKGNFGIGHMSGGEIKDNAKLA